MVAIAIAPLSVEQAQGILETLSLLNTEQHKTSKIVFYETSITLETDSSTLRTVYSWTSSVTSTAKYYAGLSTETGSRKLSDLPALIERVHAVMTDQKNIPLELHSCRNRQKLAENAQMGLTALQANRYQAKPDKALFFTATQTVLGKIKELYKERADAYLQGTFAEARVKREREEEARAAQAAQRELEVSRLKEKIADLERVIERDQKRSADWLILLDRTKQTAEAEVEARYKQRIADLERLITTEHSTNENWTQLLVAKEQEYSKKLAEKERLLAGVVLSNAIDFEKVPTTGILAMIRVLFDILTGRQAHQKE